VNLAVFRRPKVACSPSYTNLRPKTNAAILWDMGYTKRSLCKGRIGQEKEPKSWMRLMCSLYRKEYRNFKLAGATMGSGLRMSKEEWKRQINWSCNTHTHENTTRKLPV
jgi:hypothetical protein